MYLHIGEGKIVKKRDIIGIFDIETTSIGKKTREFFKICEKNGKIINLSQDIPRTYVIAGKRKKEKVYITQLSSQTLNKRAERNEDFGTEY